MTRMLAFIAALLLTAITVSSACVASSTGPLQFTIEPRSSEQVHVRFQRDRSRNNDHSWESSFRPGELAGLDIAALDSPGTRPLRFTIAREAGRIDCAGSGGNEMARGTCTLTPDAQFNRFLADHVIGSPTEDETFTLMALNVRKDLVTALERADYPVPTIDKLVEVTAVGVTPAYIDGLARAGYRPQSLDGLVQFAALNVTPDYIGSLIQAGYSNLPPDDVVQMKAMNITPQYVAGFQRIGYGHLPVDTLVQLKALDITPEYVVAVQQGGALPSPDHLVQMKAVTDDLRKH